MLQYFENEMQLLVGGLKTIDTIDTVASMAEKIMKYMPSFIRTSLCNNSYCSVHVSESTSTKLSLNVCEDTILIQQELNEYLQSSEEVCVYCGEKKNFNRSYNSHSN